MVSDVHFAHFKHAQLFLWQRYLYNFMPERSSLGALVLMHMRCVIIIISLCVVDKRVVVLGVLAQFVILHDYEFE